MRRTLVLVLLAAPALLAAAIPAGAKPLPSVRISALSPLQVRGLHFVSHEHVRVTLLAGSTKLVRSAVVSAAGGFVVSFGTISESDRCSGPVAVTAQGAHRDAATYRGPSPACAAAGPGVSATYSS